MHRLRLPVLLALAACGGQAARPPATAPAPTSAAARGPDLAAGDAPATGGDSGFSLPPAPADTAWDREVAEGLRSAADSAADEALLEQLAAARANLPESDAPIPEETAPAPPNAPAALAGSAVTFDIDVARFNSHDRVQYYLDFYRTTGRERFAIWLSRMPRYEAMIRRRLLAEGLPGDLVYLALIESGFSNTATSRARAVGMWQFMKGTARLYGLRVDRWVDERRDPIKATDAAVRHLKDLTETFGSYFLAAAAYNAGAGRVSRSLVRLPDDDTDTIPSDATFFRLYDTALLRRETRDYVPKLIAAAMIAKEPARYGFAPAPADSFVPYDSLVVPDMTGLDVVAKLADTTLAAIRDLNPQYLRLVTPPGRPSVVRLPPGRGASTALAYAALPASRRVTFREHLVRPGETLGALARRYHVSVGEIVASNPRLRGRVLRSGTRLVIPTAGPLPTQVARVLAAPEPRDAEFHRVRRGENLSVIAARYGVTIRQLRTWNHLAGNRVRAGQRLRVSPPATASAARAHSIRTHVVRRGETLEGLARRYGVSVQALREANGLGEDGALKRGARLKIPA